MLFAIMIWVSASRWVERAAASSATQSLLGDPLLEPDQRRRNAPARQPELLQEAGDEDRRERRRVA